MNANHKRFFAKYTQYITLVSLETGVHPTQAPRSASSSDNAFPQAEQKYFGRSIIFGPSYSTRSCSTSSTPSAIPYRSRSSLGIVTFPFLSIFASIKIPSKINKVRQPKSDAPKNANSDCCNTKLNKYSRKLYPSPSGICIFAKIIIDNGYRNKALYKKIESSHGILLIKFCVARLLYHTFLDFATVLYYYFFKNQKLYPQCL